MRTLVTILFSSYKFKYIFKIILYKIEVSTKNYALTHVDSTYIIV